MNKKITTALILTAVATVGALMALSSHASLPGPGIRIGPASAEDVDCEWAEMKAKNELREQANNVCGNSGICVINFTVINCIETASELFRVEDVFADFECNLGTGGGGGGPGGPNAS